MSIKLGSPEVVQLSIFFKWKIKIVAPHGGTYLAFVNFQVLSKNKPWKGLTRTTQFFKKPERLFEKALQQQQGWNWKKIGLKCFTEKASSLLPEGSFLSIGELEPVSKPEKSLGFSQSEKSVCASQWAFWELEAFIIWAHYTSSELTPDFHNVN